MAKKILSTFKAGSVCIAFLIIGYQVALFVQRASVLRIEANRDAPDTVYVYVSSDTSRAVRKNTEHSAVVEKVREATRPVESFRFDPNTVSVEDLQRLGFSQKQAQSIENYRSKGGRFRRKSDFAKSFVVADSVYRRLESYIDIPLVDINRADSAMFDALPGIGGYFASKMVQYREQLGGYSRPEQLMDIYHFDQDKFLALKDLITCSPPAPFALWTLPEEELARHPYIRNRSVAHAIVLFRQNSPKDSLTVGALLRAGILNEENASKLSECRIAPAP